MTEGRAMRVAIIFLLLLGILPAGACAQVPGVAFVHFSDAHAPLQGSGETIAVARSFLLEPRRDGDGLSVVPAFAVVTGDLTEFGGGGAGEGAFRRYLAYFEGFPLPVLHAMGNHDATWDCLRPALRRIQDGTELVRDEGGVRFIVLDSTVPQDPRPAFTPETTAFLARALAATPLSRPVVLFFHHPPDGREFASAAERRRIFDLLDGRPVAGLFVGHYHRAFHARVDGLDVLGGGSVLPKKGTDRGFGLVSIRGGRLRTVFRHFDGRAEEIAELRLAPRVHPVRRIEPGEGSIVRGATMRVKATVVSGAEIRSVTAGLEGRGSEMELAQGGSGGSVREGVLSLRDVPPGEQVLLVRAVTEDGESHVRTAVIRVEPEKRREAEVMFRVRLPASIRGIAVHGDRIFVARGDGRLSILWSNDGSPVAEVEAGAEIVGRPLVVEPGSAATGKGGGEIRIIVATGGGEARAFTAEGRPVWTADLGAASYAPPAAAFGLAVVATNRGELLGLDPATGERRFRHRAAAYTVESEPAFDGGRLYVGGWDEHVRAFEPGRDDPGVLREAWSAPAAGSAGATAAKRYYSPADAAPVVSGDAVYVADRARKLTIFAREDGRIRGTLDGIVAVAPAFGPGEVLCRGMDDEVLLVAGTAVIARRPAATGVVPSPPLPLPGRRAVVVSDRGIVSVVGFGASESTVTRSAAAGCHVLAAPVSDGRSVFVGALDGTLSALRLF